MFICQLVTFILHIIQVLVEIFFFWSNFFIFILHKRSVEYWFRYGKEWN